MTSLSVKERDLLERIDAKEDLRPYFFRKVKGIQWFDKLSERGYFSPEHNPPPTLVKEEGYISILNWPAIEYLVKTAPELKLQENIEYAKQFLEILVSSTEYAKANSFSNYRTWWQFSKIIQYIHPKIISIQDLNIVDYWLNDEHELITVEICEKWLPVLLDTKDTHEQQLAAKLLEFIYQLRFKNDEFLGHTSRNAELRIDHYHAKNITDKVAKLAGESIGVKAILFFDKKLQQILDELENDSWSYVWQPAIEPHKQNKHHDDAENILINAYRDSFTGYMSAMPNEAIDSVSEKLEGNYETIKRLAIHIIDENFRICGQLIDSLIDSEYFTNNYRHEMWRLLSRNYSQFSNERRKKILKVISAIIRPDDEGKTHATATAFIQASWLAAIKDFGEEENNLYTAKVKVAGAKPEHPSFSSFTPVVSVAPRSPYSLDELHGLEVTELVERLNSFQLELSTLDEETSIRGLLGALREVIKTSPLKFYPELSNFVEIDLAYVHEIIEAYRELWTEKVQLPWDDIWESLLRFFKAVIHRGNFWCDENAKKRGVFSVFIGDRSWVITSIARLIEDGTKSDDHAFNKKYLKDAEEIIIFLLSYKIGREFNVEEDAVTYAINSPRGQSLQALINITLRCCRLANSESSQDHSTVWNQIRPVYENEFNTAKIRTYEFAPLVTRYLPSFLYISKDWTLANLNRIFDRGDEVWWQCAMEGYVHGGMVFEEVYKYLKENEHFLKALNNQNLKGRIRKGVIQNIGIAYISGYESLEDNDSLIRNLITRGVYKELSLLIRFIWGYGEKEDEDFRVRLYELWPRIFECTDTSTFEGKKLASQLCLWIKYVDKVDHLRLDWLHAVAPYADIEHNSNEMLECLAVISKKQPFEAHSIWMMLLESSTSDYPEEAIREILTNLVNKKPEGLVKAKEAVSVYLRVANGRPKEWLREIENNQPGTGAL